MIARYRILYVDDEPSLLDIGRIFLERSEDFTVKTALNAPEAIRMLEQENFDAIISDYQMPEMNGIEFLIEVRRRFGSIPFILFTGRGREEVVIQAINNGADYYLQKGGEPISQFAELGHKVRLAVQQRRAETSIRDHERREADILNFLPDATFAIDTKGVVIAWNRAMEKMTGVSAAEMLGKGNYEYAVAVYHERRPVLIDLILHDDPSIAARYPTMKRDGEKIIGESTSSTLFNGKRVKIWFTAAPLYNNQGVITGAIESIRDVTEIKRTEEELLRKNDELYASYEQITATEEELRANLDELSRQEQALRESEQRVRQKLESLLAPEGDIESLDLGDLIDLQVIQQIMEDFSKLTGMVTAILDQRGKVLVTAGWHDICTRFHRVHPTTAGFCTESDLHLTKQVKQGEYVAYKCKNNLWDVVTPLCIGEKHMGNIFMGQFFFDDEAIDESVFIEQAQKYGFDRDEYMEAFHRVPRISREQVANQMRYLVKFTSFISRLSYSNLKLARTVKERDDLLSSLQKSEEKFRTLVENIPLKIFIKDQDFRFVSCNERFAQDFGIHADEIVGKVDADFFPPELEAKYHADDIRVLRRGQTEELEEVYPLNGRVSWIHMIKTVVRDREGEITGILGAFWDITERRQAEEAIAKSEKLHRTIIETTMDGFWMLNLKGELVDVNETYCKMSGYTRAELLTFRISDLDPIEKPAERTARIQRITAHGSEIFEARHRRKDGSLFDVEVSTTYLNMDDGRIICFSRDVTERKRAEEAVHQANRKLTLLSSITRHDITNQLTILMGHLAILQMKLTDSALNKTLQKVSTAAQHISAIIQFTKEYEAIGVNAPIWQTLASLVKAAESQVSLGKVVVKTDFPTDAEIFADPLVVKVFYNLIDNAVRHGGGITAIRFSYEDRADTLVVVCEDDGEGIAAEEKEQIFERGYGKNTGLGLSLSREILDITGISIRETGEQGKGARFEMTVPRGGYRLESGFAEADRALE